MTTNRQEKIAEYFKRWDHANNRVEDLGIELRKAECHLKSMENALGRVLIPFNAKDDEVFCFWCNDRLIECTVTCSQLNGNHDVSIKERKG